MRRSGFRVMLVLVSILILSVMVVPGVLAAPLQEGGDLPISTQPQDLIVVLTNLTRAVGVGFVVSFLFKNPGWFVNLTSKAKWWIIFGLSVSLPVVAQLLLDYVPPGVWETLNPYWSALSWGFIGWATSQVVYEKIVKPAMEGGA